jgi:hypothetical protein
MLASITQIQSPFNFFLNQILIPYCRFKICKLYITFWNNLFVIFMLWFCPDMWQILDQPPY